jgi:hypothetical protein
MLIDCMYFFQPKLLTKLIEKCFFISYEIYFFPAIDRVNEIQ